MTVAPEKIQSYLEKEQFRLQLRYTRGTYICCVTENGRPVGEPASAPNMLRAVTAALEKFAVAKLFRDIMT